MGMNTSETFNAPAKYVESAADKRLFEQVYLAYTEEYLKGPLYVHEDKFQGNLPDFPGRPIRVNGKLTSNVVGNLKTFSSNELAFFSLLFFGIACTATSCSTGVTRSSSRL